MTTTWFISDLHLGHKFLSDLRGFSTTGEHDETILANLAEAVRPGDVLWVLGDLSSGRSEAEERALTLIDDRLPGVEKHLVPGNHDSCHPLFKSAFRRQRRFLEVFDSVQAYQKMRWDGEDVYLCHFPRPGQDHVGMPSRYDDLRLTVPYLIHGHLHSTFPVTGRGQVDVGVEAWDLKPVPLEILRETLWGSLSRYPD
ncbi:Calcineurin-like phosphoesterase [Corynebacterium faecale]|uniref:metallophosphoesterase n=1 Tax=Corynebacterium faecale TaxID=1758466 RepID=UPI0025B41932|nr:metallophosphoesterase [Corynebacterium faecale]WJY92865.1 Calcineurin-like phosphoesterase [Corynebacterium faecale]